MNTKSIQGKLLIMVLTVLGATFVMGGFWLSRINKIGNALNELLKVRQNLLDSAAVNILTTPDTANELALLQQESTTLFWSAVAFVILITLILVAGGYRISRSLAVSLRNPLHVLQNLVQGNTSLHATAAKDEFAPIVIAANHLSENIKRLSHFSRSIGEGNFDFDFKPVSNEDTLGNALMQMREKLKSIAEGDKKRNWTTEGLTMFADFIRKSNDRQVLSDTLISELVKYTKSNQGSLFILNRDIVSDPYLELMSCYAYDRKKHISKRIDIGSGLLGQVFLEGNAVHLTQIPKNYVTITSGLGQANPTSLLLVPLKLNEVIEGVVELASFRKYEPHEIEFVQRVGEIIASAISTARITEQTQQMLSESQVQTEQMRAQEEEMRQNMEEMQATQEAMQRQTEETRKMQMNLELEKSMFHILMEFLPDRITYKDAESRILRINKAKAQRLNLTPEEVIGKTDYDFFSKEHAAKAMKEEKELIDSGKPLMDVEERLVFNNGDTAWVSTSRIPFKNDRNQITGMFIITKDITKLKAAELSVQDRDIILNRFLKDLPVFHYKVNHERKIVEAWKGNVDLPVSKLVSQSLKDMFPNVYLCMEDMSTNVESKTCIDSSEFSGGTFKHYLFRDSLHADSYWIFALMSGLTV